MKDYVKCTWCEFIGKVDIGAEKCPNCGHIGALAWANEDMKEVEDD